jgi:hypothetical protein
MTNSTHLNRTDSLADQIVDEIESLIRESTTATRPLELEPFRGRLFELFVMAEGAGCLREDAARDLSADGLCQELADRWGLQQATREAFADQSRLPPDQLQNMRSLWSVMRMWMEWDYAWSRWSEFRSDR